MSAAAEHAAAAAAALAQLMAGLDALQARLHRIASRRRQHHHHLGGSGGGGESSKRGQTTSSSSSSITTATATSSSAGRSSRSSSRSAAAPPLPDADFGRPELTPAQRRLADRFTAGSAPPKYELRRRRLPVLPWEAFAARAGLNSSGGGGGGSGSGVLWAVALLDDTLPLSRRLEASALEGAAHRLAERAASDPSSPAARVRLVRLDGAGWCRARAALGLKSAPMLVFTYGGRVVDAGNNWRTADDVVARALKALAAGQRGEAFGGGGGSGSGSGVGAAAAAAAESELLDGLAPGLLRALRGGPAG